MACDLERDADTYQGLLHSCDYNRESIAQIKLYMKFIAKFHSKTASKRPEDRFKKDMGLEVGRHSLRCVLTGEVMPRNGKVSCQATGPRPREG